MAFSLNKIQLIGYVGQDPEHKQFEGGGSVTIFSLATTHSWKVKDSEKYENETTWHRIKIYSISDFMLDAIKKGARFYVEGRLQKRDYEKDGEKKQSIEIIADRFNGLIPLNDKSTNKPPLQEPIGPEQDDDIPF